MMTGRVSFAPRKAYLSEAGSCFNSRTGGDSMEGKRGLPISGGKLSNLEVHGVVPDRPKTS
jgi:hypothetical protein